MWIKICANTNIDDALAAAELGAEAVGFVFAPSKRQVTPRQAGQIAAALPAGVERVGVFGQATAAEIASAAGEAHLTAVQLHSGYDTELTAELRRLLPSGIDIIQTVSWQLGDPYAADEVHAALERLAGEAGRVLVDTRAGAASGGTGLTFDWAQAQVILSERPRLIVAGGLRPENVAEAIRTLRPWGVDVASGVESVPGRKDYVKLKAFIENARGA